MTTSRDLVSKRDIAEMLGCSPASVGQWRFYQRSGVPAYATFPTEEGVQGRTLLWDRSKILAWATQTGRRIVNPNGRA
jgi:predicted DNA-binding transcriptional regulator AlpA